MAQEIQKASPAVPAGAPSGANGNARDPWLGLQRYTAARIALGRSGGSQRTDSVLDFRLAHARARDAVHTPLDLETLARQFAEHGLATEPLASAVDNRTAYLSRPDLGRRLDPASREHLQTLARQWGRRDLAIIVSDGLAAQAAERHAVETTMRLAGLLTAENWTLYPVLLVPFGRVKIQDEIGSILGARHTLMLLGERPGLGSPDSLGAYFTHHPNEQCTDADRNCLSNIRPEGLPPPAAARKLARLLLESARLGVSGVALKDMESSGTLETR